MWDNTSIPVELSDWQEDQLQQQESPIGVKCLLKMWFNYSYPHNLTDGTFCNATWDNVYCWSPTPAGTVLTLLCSVAFQETQPAYAGHLSGNAVRICQNDGTWSEGVRTNYEECATSFEEYERKVEAERRLVSVVQHILFIGSILSLACLATALSIFGRFRSLWCGRVKVLVHLMLALVLRFIMLFVITEPFVFGHSRNYRDIDILCKTVISLYLYATVTSVSWMFVQGLYLNSKLTTNVFSDDDAGNRFVIYYILGWVLPACLLVLYLVTMVYNSQNENCWKGYADLPEIWILVGPMIFALLLNAGFLLNILRILLQKLRTSHLQSAESSSQIMAAAKATLILSPVLGINNLLVLYNPGGAYEKYYVMLNTFFGSTQGIFVSIVYCFSNQEVQDTLRRWLNRQLASSTTLTIQDTRRRLRSSLQGSLNEDVETRAVEMTRTKMDMLDGPTQDRRENDSVLQQERF